MHMVTLPQYACEVAMWADGPISAAIKPKAVCLGANSPVWTRKAQKTRTQSSRNSPTQRSYALEPSDRLHIASGLKNESLNRERNAITRGFLSMLAKADLRNSVAQFVLPPGCTHCNHLRSAQLSIESNVVSLGMSLVAEVAISMSWHRSTCARRQIIAGGVHVSPQDCQWRDDTCARYWTYIYIYCFDGFRRVPDLTCQKWYS